MSSSLENYLPTGPPHDYVASLLDSGTPTVTIPAGKRTWAVLVQEFGDPAATASYDLNGGDTVSLKGGMDHSFSIGPLMRERGLVVNWVSGEMQVIAQIVDEQEA